MKKFIKKHLSVILSLAIILGTVLPVISGFTGVSALSPEEQTMVDNIKTAWSNLSLTETDYNILPNRWWNVSGSVASANMADSSTYAETLPEGVDLGSKYATFTSLGDVAATESKQCILYEFKNDTAGSFAGQDRTTYNIDTIANVYFWIKIDNMTKDANLRISVRGHSGGLYLIPETITIPATKSGQWVKVSLRDETSGNWCGTITGQPFYRVMVALNNVSGSTVTAGSGTLEKKISMPSDSETANWTLIDWIKAALKVDLSAYGNTEGFVTALNTAKSAFGEQYAIANLVKEWEALAVYHDPDINPNRWWGANGGSATATNMAESSTYTGTLPDGVDLGANFATFTGLGNTAGISSRQCILYEFCKDGSGSSTITAGAKSSDKINEMDDIYFWFKADNMASDITINIQVMTNDTTAKTNNLPAFVIPSSKSGQWVKVSLKEIGGSEWYGVLNEKLFRVMVAMANAQGATVTVGSGKIVIPGACPVPANVADTADAWIKAANDLDTSNCVDDSAFRAAVSALGVYATIPDAAVEALKEEWAKLQYVGTPDTDGFKVGIWQVNGGSTYKESNTGATQLVYDTGVDTAYGENQFTATGAKAGDKAYFRKDGSDSYSTYALKDLNDIWFWYKASGNTTVTIQIYGYNGSTNYNPAASKGNISLAGDNTWKKISIIEVFGEDWQTAITNKGTIKPTRIVIGYDVIENASSVDATFGQIYFVEKDKSLNGSEAWTNEQWVDNARALDLSDYKNTAAFEAALYAAIESVYGFTKADLAAQELIDAWGKLSLPEHNNILPNRWWNVSGSVASANMADSTTYTGVLPEGVDLGAKYAVFTGLGDVAATESKQCILYEFKDGSTGTIDGRDRITEYDISDIVDVSFWLKIDNMTKDANLRIKVRGHSGGEYLIPETITIPATKSGQWVKISLKDATSGLWHGDITGQPFYRVMVALNDVSGSTVTAGSGTIQRKIAIPDNAANMEPQEILIAAMELDLSQYGNTQQFIEKMEALKLLCEEAVAISQLKDAMGNLSYTDSNNLLPNRWYDPTKTISSTNMSDSTTYSDELPAGADLGANYAVVTGLGDVSYLDQQQSIIMEFKNGSNGSYEGKDRTPYDVSSASDVSFWVKFDNMTKDAYIRIKVLGHNSGGTNLIPESVTVPMSKSGEWFKISLKEITGADWNKGLSNGLFRVLVGLNDATGSTVTIGSGFVDVKAINIEGEANWSLADWIYEAMKIDYQQYVGADEFKAALDYAVDVRDRLQISRSSNVTEYDTHALADADKATVIGTNCLEIIVPAIYHSADGNTKNEVSSAAPELFTDGDNTTVGVVSGLDNTNEASFTQFVYKFKGEARISDFFIYNDNANIADKYYIYMSDSESDLFLQENLLVPFTNGEGKSVQRFNFEGKPEVKGNYIGIRVYSDSDTVSFAEFAAYGEVITYDVETGNFTNSQIANIGDNLLKDVAAKAKTTIKFDWQGFLGGWANQYHYSKLTDNNTSTPVAIYANNVIVNKDDTISVHIYYDLGTTYTIDKLFLNHWDNKGLETGKYEIYASKDINSLFMSRSMVLSYDNTVDGPNGTTLSQLFTLKNEVVARFVSFRITYPISDWDYCETRSDYGKLYGIRLSELGVYGTEWVKPYALVNLTSHVPMDVYRTDANGKQTKVEESEYSGSEHKYTYDGNDATVADIKIKNGEKLDFVYNLAAEMTLEEICMKLGVGSVKKMNIYASTVKDSIWDSSSLIYSANDALGETYFGKGYAGSPIKARYIRFEILENEGEDLIINELEAIGGNDQEFNYMNLIEEKPESASFYLQEKDTGLFAGTTEYGNKWLGSWKSWNGLYPFYKAFDNDYDTVYDLFGGKNGEESVSILLDLGTLNSIDDIILMGGSEPEYWPDEINYYFGEDSVALFDKDAKPAKSWMTSTDDGIFTYEFVPQVAQYVRIEFVRCEDSVYSKYFDYVSAIISEIQVHGLELKSRAVNGIVATVEDEETGIKAEILALRDNDVFDTIQSLTVIKRKPSADELASAKEQGLKVDTDIYEIYFIDANGDIVTDAGDREVIIYIPEKLTSSTEEIFVLKSEFGGLSMIEFDSADGYYYFTIDDISSALNVALGYMVEDEEVFDDTDDSDSEDTDDEFDEDENDEDEDEDDDNLKRKKKIKVVRKAKGDNNYLWIILAIGAGVVVIAAAVILIIVLKKKKDKESEE